MTLPIHPPKLPVGHPLIAAGAEVPLAPGAVAPTGVDLYARFAFAGAVCCAVTHGALTPVDVVTLTSYYYHYYL